MAHRTRILFGVLLLLLSIPFVGAVAQDALPDLGGRR